MTEELKTRKPKRTASTWLDSQGYPGWALAALTEAERNAIIPALRAGERAAELTERAARLRTQADECDDEAKLETVVAAKLDGIKARLERLKEAAGVQVESKP